MEHFLLQLIDIHYVGWPDWLYAYFCFILLGWGLIFMCNKWGIHYYLDLYYRHHPKASTIATILVVLFWPLSPYIVRKTGEWILKSTPDPLDWSK